MKLEHIYWIAAYLDGEGSFGWNNTPVIQATSVDRDLIARFRDYADRNAGIYTVDPRDCRQIQYKVCICASMAIQLMMTIYPLMCRRRKDKIKEVIALWMKVGMANENKTLCPKGHRLSGSNLVIDAGTGGRRCRVCKNENNKRYQHKRRLNA